MQAEVGRDSEDACSGQETEKSFGMQPGAEIGPTFPKPWEVLSGRSCRPLREQLDRQGQAGGWVGGCPPGFLEEALGVPEIRMHFPESGSSCGRPCLLLGAGPG